MAVIAPTLSSTLAHSTVPCLCGGRLFNYLINYYAPESVNDNDLLAE